MIARMLLILALVPVTLALAGSASAAPFPTDFSVIGLHDDTFYGLDTDNPAIVRWINKRTGASGEISTGGVRSDISTNASFSGPENGAVFSSSGMAVGTSANEPLDLPRQLYRITRSKGFELLANFSPWSHTSCGEQMIPLHISSSNEVIAVELSISRSGGSCAQVNEAKVVRYDTAGRRSEIPVSADLRSWIRWSYGSTNIVANDRYLAIATKVTKRQPQSRIAFIDARTGKTVRRLNAAPRGFAAKIEFATANRLLVWSRVPGRRVQIRHIPIRGRSRVIRRGSLASIVRACGMRTAATDRSFAFWVYGSDGRQQRKITTDGYFEPGGMLCSRQYFYFYSYYWSESESEYSSSSGLVDLTRLR